MFCAVEGPRSHVWSGHEEGSVIGLKTGLNHSPTVYMGVPVPDTAVCGRW